MEMRVQSILNFPFLPMFADISRFVDYRITLFAKLEGFNPGGSIKLKPALSLVEELEETGNLQAGRGLIDTSSGNMGVALALVAKAKGYSFICVTDEKITDHNRRLLRAYGAELVVLHGSTLAQRYEYIEHRLRADTSLRWTKQFRNWANPRAHASTTALEIMSFGKPLDYLFVGVGTGGTLAGCARVLGEQSRQTKIVAVDAEGSVHFKPLVEGARRRIPGIGATERSPFLDGLTLHDVVVVREIDAVRTCLAVRDLTGWLFGGSSGSVLAAVGQIAPEIQAGSIAMAICADFGERYLDTIYNPQWRRDNFPELGSKL
jgi:2,3-diaminopropionate biosynthesis protein SbnA